MTGTNSKGRSKRDAKHVRLYAHLLDCPAYRSMSCYGRATLIELMYRHDGLNNGRIPLSVREAAERLGVCINTAAKALREIEVKGFAKPTKAGSFSWKTRHATEWALATEPILLVLLADAVDAVPKR